MGFLDLYAGTERIAVGPDVDRAAAKVQRLSEAAKGALPNSAEYQALLLARTELADLSEGAAWWVSIKEYLTNTDYSDAQRALVLPKMRGGEVTGTLESQAYQQVVVLKAIVGWNLTDAAGQELPVTLASVCALPQSVFLRLYARITELNDHGDLDVPPGATDREVRSAEAQFPDPAGEGSVVALAARGPSAMDNGGSPAQPVLDGAGMARAVRHGRASSR